MSAGEHKATECKHASPRPWEAALAVVVVGSSAGGLSALRTIVEMLPRRSRMAVVIAQHLGGESVLPQLIQRWSGLDACFATEDVALCAGRVYVCPPAHHVVVKPDGTLGVARRERLAFVRPSIDWLFESAAASFGDRAIAVLLSGSNADGARGTQYICKAGGTVIVQDPATCGYPQMPSHAIAMRTVDFVLPPAEIAPAILSELARVAAAYPSGWADPFGDAVAAG